MQQERHINSVLYLSVATASRSWNSWISQRSSGVKCSFSALRPSTKTPITDLGVSVALRREEPLLLAFDGRGEEVDRATGPGPTGNYHAKEFYSRNRADIFMFAACAYGTSPPRVTT